MRHDWALYRAEQLRALDALAIEQGRVEGSNLMEQAGLKAWQVLRARWPEVKRISVCCGGGNNGGDGWVIARHALAAGLSVQAITVVDPDRLESSARQAYEAFAQHPNAEPAVLFDSTTPLTGEVVVDALLGTGLRGPATGLCAICIETIVGSLQPVLSVDVPSGLLADTGAALGPCVRAQVTVGFVGQKRGLFTGEAARFCGRLVFDALGADRLGAGAPAPDAALFDVAQWDRSALKRPLDAHKGECGHVCVIGGAPGMAGAPVLSALGALHAGAGKVTVLGSADTVTAALAQSPALMARDIFLNDQWQATDLEADVVAIGPGLGPPSGPGVAGLMKAALAFSGPVVVDADGLNALAGQTTPARTSSWVLTPHPGEAARLLGVDTAAVQADRFEAARALARQHRAIVVLKGWGSLIATPEGTVWVCPRGASAMATAGMGDVLTGVIASLLGQGMAAVEAAKCGVLIHALAGEVAALDQRQITADQLTSKLSQVMASKP